MKLITLNTWGGVVFEPLIDFIKEYSKDTDIFCFQEVLNGCKTPRATLGKVNTDLFNKIKEAIPDFNGYYAPAEEKDIGGLATFIKNPFFAHKTGNILIFPDISVSTDRNDKDYFSVGRNLQQIGFKYWDKEYTIFNFHGMWTGKGKGDTKRRIDQSHRVRKYFDQTKGPRILCGDFNLSPDTESMAILNQGNRNLIEEFHVTSTRSSLYTKPAPFADYVIISPEIKVKSFEALKDEVSDHLPLSMDFE